MTQTEATEHLAELMRGIKITMLCYTDARGGLRSQPMATQDVEFVGDCWFIAERDSSCVQALQRNPRVNLAYTGDGNWVSLSGTARIVDDVERLKEYWDTFTDSWLDGGPDNPNNVLIQVSADSAEYWDSPGGKVTQLANVVKTRLTGERVEGDNAQLDL